MNTKQVGITPGLCPWHQAIITVHNRNDNNEIIMQTRNPPRYTEVPAITWYSLKNTTPQWKWVLLESTVHSKPTMWNKRRIAKVTQCYHGNAQKNRPLSNATCSRKFPQRVPNELTSVGFCWPYITRKANKNSGLRQQCEMKMPSGCALSAKK